MQPFLKPDSVQDVKTSSAWKHDLWLSQYLGKAAYHLNLQNMVPGELEASFNWLKATNPAIPFFVDVKIPTANLAAVEQLEKNGFFLIDTAVTCHKVLDLQPKKISAHIRLAQPSDEDQVVHLAMKNSRTSRFHLDSRIESEKADRIKGEWVRNFFLGQRGDALVVAEVNGKIAGFALYLFLGQQMTLDLIAIDEPFRRKGIAAELVIFAERSFEKETFNAGTQISNLAALNFYEKLGFRILKTEYVFHFHL